jgi:transcriptional regulator with XRE-family HTH domain
MDNASIKENIRRTRKDKGMTQEDMAAGLGISLTAYRDLERGGTNMMNANLIRIAELLDTSLEELLLGYKPVQADGMRVEEVRAEYGGRISVMERRISDLEKLVSSLEETISSKSEIISMLKKKLGEEE